jgi:large subunit ribosomal protein L21
MSAIRLAEKYLNNIFITMYAIVEIQGQQFNVEPDQKICVLNIAGAKVGDEVVCDKVLLVNNDGVITVGTPTVEGAKVVFEVSQVELRGKKIKVFHKIRRKGFDKLVGSRQHFTEVLVKSIVA